MNKERLDKLVDLYEFTMTAINLEDGKQNQRQYYDMFFRKNVNDTGYTVASGLDTLIDKIQNFRFAEEEIEYLRSLNLFNENYLSFLKDFRFKGDIYAVPDGTPIFPGEPVITVCGNAIECKLIETDLLNVYNHQALIATRARRAKEATKTEANPEGKNILEFGARRAHGDAAAIEGAKAAYIGGAMATSCFGTGFKYGVPVTGTMAHSFVSESENEYEAFKRFAEMFPDNAILLVDTVDTLRSGVPNAIKVAKEVLVPMGKKLKGIRLDSGDLIYLSKEARRMLDEAGLEDAKIAASDDLDESKITEFEAKGAKIDTYALGTKLITSSEQSALGMVYKLVAQENEFGVIEPIIKLSDNAAKTINPGLKDLYRIYDNETGYAVADYITLYDEEVPTDNLFLFHPNDPTKQTTLTNYTAKRLRKPIFKNGELVYNLPDVHERKAACEREMSTLYPEAKRRTEPHYHWVDLSQNLWDLKQDMITEKKRAVDPSYKPVQVQKTIGTKHEG